MKNYMTNKTFLISNILVLLLLVLTYCFLVYFDYYSWLVSSFDLAFLNLFLSIILFYIRQYIITSYFESEYKDFVIFDTVLFLFWFFIMSLYMIFYV